MTLETMAAEREATAGGDRAAALRRLYETHKDEVFGFLVKLCRDRALAEDVLHDAFVRVHQSLDRFDATRPARPWIFRIVRNAALDALRRRRKGEGKLGDDDDDEEGSAPSAASSEPLAALERQEQIARARAALERLPAETRALLLQRHGLDMKLEDLALSWSCTERTVRNRLRDACEKFQSALAAPAKHGEGS